MSIVVVGKVPGFAAVADNEQLDEAKQRSGISVTGIMLVIHNLFHGPARTDGKIFQFYLYDGNPVEQNDDVIAVVTAGRIDAKLVDDFKGVFAPVERIYQSEGKRRAVIPFQGLRLAKGAGRLINIAADDHVHESGEFGFGKVNPIQRFKVGTEVLFQRCAVMNVRSIGVLEIIRQLGNELLFYILFQHGTTVKNKKGNKR